MSNRKEGRGGGTNSFQNWQFERKAADFFNEIREQAAHSKVGGIVGTIGKIQSPPSPPFPPHGGNETNAKWGPMAADGFSSQRIPPPFPFSPHPLFDPQKGGSLVELNFVAFWRGKCPQMPRPMPPSQIRHSPTKIRHFPFCPIKISSKFADLNPKKMFRLDRRIRSASSKFKKLENSAEMALAKAQQTATRTLSLRSRSRSRPAPGDREREPNEALEGDGCEGADGGGPSNTLLGLLSPRNWGTNGKSGGGGNGRNAAAFELCKEDEGEMDLEAVDLEKMNYVEVKQTDTLEGIAAAHDCTVGQLVKLNKLHSRMVFPGQKLFVPTTEQQEPASIANGKPGNNCSKEKNSGIHKGPGHAVAIPPNPKENRISATNSLNLPENNQSTQQTLSKTKSAPPVENAAENRAELGRMASEMDPEDQECLQRFLKIRVKQVTESDGTIVGTLLVTPNCLMFDPDIDHPLVQEKGSDLYGMVANMEDIVSVTVYKNISSLIGEKRNKEEDIFDPKQVTSSPKKSVSRKGSDPKEKSEDREEMPEKRRQSDAKLIPRRSTASGEEDQAVIGFDGDQTFVYGTSAGGLLLGSSLDNSAAAHLLRNASTGSSLSNSEQQLPSIDEEKEINQQKKEAELSPERGDRDKRRTVSDMNCEANNSNDEFPFDQQKRLKGNQQSNSLDLQPMTERMVEERQRAHSDLEQSNSLDIGGAKNHLRSGGEQQRRSPSPSSPFSRYSPGMARKSFGKLGRTLSAKATSLKGTVQSGAQTVASGTQKVAHGMVTHTLSAADHIQTGIQNGAKVVASVPGSIVNVSAGLLQEGQNGVMEVVDTLKEVLSEGMEQQPERTPQAMKRERSLATLESLCQRTQQAREQAVQRAFETGFVLGSEERPVLDKCDGDDENDVAAGAKGNGEERSNGNGSRPIGTPPEPPYYMTVRVDRRKKRKRARLATNPDDPPTNSNSNNSKENIAPGADYFDEGCAFGNKRKREFWFAVPRSRVDAIYHFLLQWSPQKYGQVKASTADETNCLSIENNVQGATANGKADNANASSLGAGGSEKMSSMLSTSATGKQHLGAFVVLDREVDETLAGEKPSDHHFGKLDREWEVVTVRELCRRLSLEDSLEPSEMPLPEGALQSQVLDEFMLRQIVDILPPRAEGYPWINIYNSEKHGFSLATLYRKMSEWKEEMSPVLLVIRDVQGHVFGAVTSTALRPADHYYGTGDSCLLFRFTGEYPHTRELRTYNWTGNNQFFVNATKDFLSVGAGGGHYGLWLDADLNNGRSQKCATFDNEPLAGGLDEDFVIQFVEAFGFSM